MEEPHSNIIFATAPGKKIMLFVRRDDSSTEPARTIAIHPIPGDADGITAEDLLNAGFAIDGDSAVLTVTPLTIVARDTGVAAGVAFPPEILQVNKGSIDPQSLPTALQSPGGARVVAA